MGDFSDAVAGLRADLDAPARRWTERSRRRRRAV